MLGAPVASKLSRMRRLATPEDLNAVFSLYMHEKVVPYLGYDPMPLEDFRAIYQELVASRCFFVYELDLSLIHI